MSKTCKLLGKVWGNTGANATVTVTWNGSQVFSGACPATPLPDDLASFNDFEAVCSWDVSDDTSGVYPLRISVTGGSLTFQNVLINKYSSTAHLELDPNAIWPGHTPASLEELAADSSLLPAEFEAKYNFTHADVGNQTIIVSEKTAEENFVDPSINTEESDGKTDVTIDGRAINARAKFVAVLGPQTEFRYTIGDGSVLECNFNVMTVDEWKNARHTKS
jgi:hypothetical protein